MKFGGGLFGLLLLIAAIFAIIRIWKSSAEELHKILWIALVAFLPLIGLIAWYIAGPGDKSLPKA